MKQQKIILKQIQTNCLELINPNAGRIRYDIDYRVTESYRKFKYHFDQKLLELLQSLKNIIEESILAKSSIEENIEAKLKNLYEQQQTISQQVSIMSKISLEPIK